MKFVTLIWPITLATGMTHAGAEDSGLPTVAYHAQAVVVSDGTSTKFRIVSDGLRTSSVVDDGKSEKSGSYSDRTKKLQWVYGPELPCFQAPLSVDGAIHDEKLLGSEVIDGHPTQKFSVSDQFKIRDEAISELATEWRATDLGNLVIQRVSKKGTKYSLRDIVVGMPDAKEMAMPEGCKYDEMQDTSRSAATTSGGYRTVSYSDLSCKKLVPLPLTFELPSDFEIRDGGPPVSCFAGRHDDLASLMKVENELQFDALRHGVFWLHVSDSTYYDGSRKRFISEQGSDDQWPDAWAQAMGATDVNVVRKEVAGIPSLRINARVGSKTVRMLFLGFDDSPAIRISYQPGSSGAADDEAQWQHFIDSIANAK